MKLKLIFSLLLFCSGAVLYGQNRNAYKFIEPNVSISYDSNMFAIKERYSNTFYGTESYDFIVKGDKKKIKIHVKASNPSTDSISMEDLQKIMTKKIDGIEEAVTEETKVIAHDKQVRKVGNFLCFGVTMQLIPFKSNMTAIVCNHISENDLTEVDCNFPYSGNIDSCYLLVKQFVEGIKFYSKELVDTEESTIKKNYTVSVISKDAIEKFQWRPSTYLGIVKLKEPLQHTVKEVRLKMQYGEEIFEALPNGEVPICCNDKEKGEIKKQGDLIILNSFGKIVKIPFEFIYTSK